jgi:hypothetical protein
MSDPTVVRITRLRLLELLEAENKLKALHAGGVDNWDWYQDSINDHYRPPTEADLNAEIQW